MRRAAADLARLLRGARGDLAVAVRTLTNAAPPAGSTTPEGCSSHARIGKWEPISRNERCDWCYRFWLTERIDPPIEILQAHDRGEKLSLTRVEAAVHAVRGPRPKKRKKTRAGR